MCMMSDADLIERFLEVGGSTVRCNEVMLAWRNRVAPLTPTEFRKFGEPWFMLMHGDLAHSLRMLRRLMMEEEELCNVVETEGDDVTDAEMLEAVEQLEPWSATTTNCRMTLCCEPRRLRWATMQR